MSESRANDEVSEISSDIVPWDRLDEATDTLLHYCFGVESAIRNMEKYRSWIVEIGRDDHEIVEQLALKLIEFMNKRPVIKDEFEKRL
uniref:Uncharacterized protein n=1 Tax=Caenorhabditis japonica TaxID=281687 RepID=A0A8R1DU13_CAEJA